MRFPNGMVRATLLAGSLVYGLAAILTLRKVVIGIQRGPWPRPKVGPLDEFDFLLLLILTAMTVSIIAVFAMLWIVRLCSRRLRGHCRYCGEKLEMGDTLCMYCGTRSITRSPEALFPVGPPIARPYRKETDSASMP